MHIGGCLVEYTFGEGMIRPYLRECEGIVTEVNKEFIELTGFEMGELLGKALEFSDIG